MMRLEDVARLAGVSTITVSRVINTPELVKPATREKVERALEELNYVQNPVARALASTRSASSPYTFRFDRFNQPVRHALCGGISEVLSKHVYSFLIRRTLDNEHLCDGYIATGLLKDEVKQIYQYTHERNRPLVLFGHTEHPDIDCIDVDNTLGAKKITQLLLENGHRQIAMINVDEDKDYTVDRALGFRRALDEAGLNPLDCPQIIAANNVEGGYGAMKRILTELPIRQRRVLRNGYPRHRRRERDRQGGQKNPRRSVSGRFRRIGPRSARSPERYDRLPANYRDRHASGRNTDQPSQRRKDPRQRAD
jgi:LacI family transcriptional regulator